MVMVSLTGLRKERWSWGLLAFKRGSRLCRGGVLIFSAYGAVSILPLL